MKKGTRKRLKKKTKEYYLDEVLNKKISVDEIPEEDMSEELCDYLIQNGVWIEYIPFNMLTEKVCHNAIDVDDEALGHIPYSVQSFENCKFAVDKYGLKQLEYMDDDEIITDIIKNEASDINKYLDTEVHVEMSSKQRERIIREQLAGLISEEKLAFLILWANLSFGFKVQEELDIAQAEADEKKKERERLIQERLAQRAERGANARGGNRNTNARELGQRNNNQRNNATSRDTRDEVANEHDEQAANDFFQSLDEQMGNVVKDFDDDMII